MQIKKYIPIGSYVNNTYIEGVSDRDYLVVVNEIDFYNGINNLANNLNSIYNVVNIDVPSLRVLHHGLFADFTPCIVLNKIQTIYGEFDNYRIYDTNGYKDTCPQLYNFYITHIDKHHKNKVSEFIREVKLWKYQKNINIASFYIEILCVDYFEKSTIVKFDDFINELSVISENEINVIVKNIYNRLIINDHDRR